MLMSKNMDYNTQCLKPKKTLLLVWTVILIGHVSCIEKEITISIEPGKKDCFYQYVKSGQIIDVEYQVVDGGHGDLDTSFDLAEPNGRILYADFKKSDNIHRHKVDVEGDYRICFDNSFSRFNKKTVFFEIIIENENGDSEDDDWNNNLLEGLTPEEFYDMKVDDIQNALGRVRVHLTKARQTQDLLKSFEKRDLNMAEANFNRVNVWSMFQIVLMVAVGALQVFMVRSLFEDDSKINTIWKKLCL